MYYHVIFFVVCTCKTFLISVQAQRIGTARATELKARFEEFEEDLVDIRSAVDSSEFIARFIMTEINT